MVKEDLFYDLEVVEDPTINGRYFYLDLPETISTDLISENIKNKYDDYDTAYNNLKKDTEYVGIFRFKDKSVYINVDFDFLKNKEKLN